MFRKKKSLPIPPGWTMIEQMKLYDWTTEFLADKLEMTTEDTLALLSGQKEIDYTMAQQLEKVFGIPASFWENLEIQYRRNQ